MREWFQTYGEIPNWPAYYNAAPTNALPVVRQASESREIALMRWGLIPYFSKHGKPSYSTIIARSEGVQSAALDSARTACERILANSFAGNVYCAGTPIWKIAGPAVNS